jgi:hypothetical protein
MPLKRYSERSCAASGNDGTRTTVALLRRAEALASPLRAFASWYLRMECAACRQERYLNETHLTIAGHGDRRVGDPIGRLKHEGCGGKPKLVELITGIPGSAAWRRRIVLICSPGEKELPRP